MFEIYRAKLKEKENHQVLNFFQNQLIPEFE